MSDWRSDVCSSDLQTRPCAAPVKTPYGSNAWACDTPAGLPTLNARLATKGYYRTRRSDFNLLFGGEQKLDALTQGLSFKAQVAYASTVDLVRWLSRPNPPAYNYDPEDGSYNLDPRSRNGTRYRDRISGEKVKSVTVQVVLV